MHPLTKLLPLAALALTHQPEAQLPLTPNSGLPGQSLTLDTIPLLGYGTWNLKGDNVSAAVSLAIQTGYRHIDAAAVYGNEKDVGAGIADGLAKTGLKREDLWITSKLWNDHHGPDNVESGLAKTLADLNLAYLDLYHMHWPVSTTTSGSPEIEYLTTWDAMVTLLLSKGLVRHLGISNFSPAQLTALLNHTAHPPSVHQMELHPYLPQSSFLALHREHGIHVTAYSPLAGTNPTYAPGRDDDETPLLQNPLIAKIAHKRHCTPAQVSLVWGMARGTSVIPKAQHADFIRENFESVGECVLKEKDLRKIDKLGVERQHRFNNPSKSWGVPLYEGLEDAAGVEDYRLRT